MKQSNHKPLIYLAVPYSHTSESVRLQRFRIANRVAGTLMKEGHCVISPISHCHPIKEVCELPHTWEFWEKQDRTFLSCCHKLIVLKIDGWQESKGVQAEMEIAKEMGIEIEFMDYWEILSKYISSKGVTHGRKS